MSFDILLLLPLLLQTTQTNGVGVADRLQATAAVDISFCCYCTAPQLPSWHGYAKDKKHRRGAEAAELEMSKKN